MPRKEGGIAPILGQSKTSRFVTRNRLQAPHTLSELPLTLLDYGSRRGSATEQLIPRWSAGAHLSALRQPAFGGVGIFAFGSWSRIAAACRPLDRIGEDGCALFRVDN